MQKRKKFILLFSIMIFLFVFLSFGKFRFELPLLNREVKTASAQEGILLWDQVPSFSLPSGISPEEGHNEREIPIGQATDMAEDVAKKIIDESDRILIASLEQINAANELVYLADQCSADRCTTGCDKEPYRCNEEPCEFHVDPCGANCHLGETCTLTYCNDAAVNPYCIPGTCDPTTNTCQAQCGTVCENSCPAVSVSKLCYETCYKCEVLPCFSSVYGDVPGNACPLNEINQRIETIIDRARIIKEAYNAIERIFTFKRHTPAGQWWCDCSITGKCTDPTLCYFKPAGLNCAFPQGNCTPTPCSPTPGGCLSDIGKIIEHLHRARTGNYYIFDYPLSGFRWERRPLGLQDCATTRAIEALEGKVPLQWLLTCEYLIRSGTIDEENCRQGPDLHCPCYGHHEVAYPERANNYICVE